MCLILRQRADRRIIMMEAAADDLVKGRVRAPRWLHHKVAGFSGHGFAVDR